MFRPLKWAISLAACAVVLALAGVAMASSVAQIEAAGSGVQTVDNAGGQYPVITAILSAPGTVNAKSYSSYSFLVNDGTGSMDVYGSLSGLGYTPTVGDAISATGTYGPYHQIPELGTLTALTQETTGNAVPPILLGTISTLNQTTLPLNVAGYEWTLDNVMISGAGTPGNTFGNANSPSGATITDVGGNSMSFYYWPTSYSVANANLYSMVIPSSTTLVDMTGFVSVYPGSPAEFNPISITVAPTPEPGTLVLLGAGLAAAAVLFLHRKANS
jgi:hypothetical protein